MKTDKEVFVSGDLKAVHVCNTCKEYTDDGRGFHYWDDEDFTLCHNCLIHLHGNI